LGAAHIELPWAVDALLGVVAHFFPVSNPPRHASEGKHHRKHVGRNTECAIEDAAIEVDIGEEFALDEIAVLEGGLFQLFGDVEQRVVYFQFRQNGVARLFQQFGTRIKILIHAVSKPHQPEPVVFVFGLGDIFFRSAAFFADGFQHFQDFLVSASMEGAGEGGDAGADGGIDAGVAGADHTHGGRRAILLMVCVDDEEEVEGVLQGFGEHIGLSGRSKHHPQEVCHIAIVAFGIDDGLADGFFIGDGDEGFGFGDEANNVQVNVVFVWIESGQSSHHGRQDVHRVGGGREVLEEIQHAFVHEAMLRELFSPVFPLLGGRQLVINEQIANLGESGLGGQVLNVIPAVAEDAALSVNEGNFAFAGARIGIALVQGDITGFGPQGRDVDGQLFFCPLESRKLDRLLSQCQFCSLHALLLKNISRQGSEGWHARNHNGAKRQQLNSGRTRIYEK